MYIFHCVRVQPTYHEPDVTVHALLGFYVYFGRAAVSAKRLFATVFVFIHVKYRLVISTCCLNNLFLPSKKYNEALKANEIQHALLNHIWQKMVILYLIKELKSLHLNYSIASLNTLNIKTEKRIWIVHKCNKNRDSEALIVLFFI